jgi:hypothetical protein
MAFGPNNLLSMTVGAKQGVATQGSGLHRRQIPLVHQHRQDHAVNEQVIAIEYQQQGTQAHHHPVKAPEARLLNHFINV